MRRKELPDGAAKSSDAGGSVIYTNLQEKRVLFLTDEINSESANRIAAQLIMLDIVAQDDIYLFINSEGGNVTDTMALYDVMQSVTSDVSTICIGEAASGAAILLAGGAKGKRYMLPNARVMLHQPQGGVEGSSRDVEIEAKELVRLRQTLSGVFEKHTGQDAARLAAILDRDTYMDAQEAVVFGMADEVIDRMPFA